MTCQCNKVEQLNLLVFCNLYLLLIKLVRYIYRFCEGASHFAWQKCVIGGGKSFSKYAYFLPLSHLVQLTIFNPMVKLQWLIEPLKRTSIASQDTILQAGINGSFGLNSLITLGSLIEGYTL